MLNRLLRTLFLGATAAVLLVLGWPQLFGLQNTWVAAHAVSLRGTAVAVSIVLIALLLPIYVLFRPVRRLAGGLVVLLLLFGVGNAGVLAVRGVGAPASAPVAETTDAVTVLSWNTLGDEPGAAAIADLALEQNADVVALPETTEATGEAVAEAMRDAGRPMWVHTLAFDQISKARSTTLLISPDLGDYTVSNEAGSGPPGNTNVLPTVVATPADRTGPTIIAVHAVAPIRWEMSNWRSDLDWLAEQCTGENVIMAGDFNATVDHLSGREATAGAVLGDCRDAALATGSGAVGTWPTFAPALLGSPIDHVLATPNWQVQSMSVIDSEDDAGSDHRPIVATLAAR
ncbi:MULTISPECIES: endonuclease/exonuclease/phosphatase family protein [Cryobacterium]|uniref:Endonuclease/exonuclease/phosphatase family protein n=1 Tax=Cryobacterium breve TaxID=1259258 RepID=A0ABY2J686_9MICO|nr:MULTISPECIES: endonuclease/exonuclease/phosphatase family protein [Cryobacterium]TFC91041.1 endonuclease/exonuclease/phosphatase family protein [Cryobacterium sp. TmT3-12]TFC99360.1 endonuclease/exonuclease/phosphatase family protein [Cryobacterium breve]